MLRGPRTPMKLSKEKDDGPASSHFFPTSSPLSLSRPPPPPPPFSDEVQISPHPSESGRRWRAYRTNSLKHASSCSPRLWCACLSSALAQFQLVWSWVRCWRGPGEGLVAFYQVHLLPPPTPIPTVWTSCKHIAAYVQRVHPKTALGLIMTF